MVCLDCWTKICTCSDTAGVSEGWEVWSKKRKMRFGGEGGRKLEVGFLLSKENKCSENNSFYLPYMFSCFYVACKNELPNMLPKLFLCIFYILIIVWSALKKFHWVTIIELSSNEEGDLSLSLQLPLGHLFSKFS